MKYIIFVRSLRIRIDLDHTVRLSVCMSVYHIYVLFKQLLKVILFLKTHFNFKDYLVLLQIYFK